MINLKIMSPDNGVCFNQEVEYVDVNTTSGHIGLQQGITAMVAIIKNSQCKIKFSNKESQVVIICGGTLFVDKQEGIKIFTKHFAYLSDLNQDEIKKTLDIYEQKIKNLDPMHKEYNNYLDIINLQKDLLESINNK